MVMQAHCPACHAAIQVKEDQAITVCLSCGKVIRIPDDLESAGGDRDSDEEPDEPVAVDGGPERQRSGAGPQGEDGAEPSELADASLGEASRQADDLDGEPIPDRFARDSAVPLDVMEGEEVETNEIPEPEERVDWEPPSLQRDDSGGIMESDGNQRAEDPLERVPTTRFRRMESRDQVEDRDLLSDIEAPSGMTHDEVSSAGSMLRFETTCPACGGLMGVEGAEVPETLTCPQCGTQVDVGAQIAAMLGNSGLRKMLSDEEEAELRLFLERHRGASGMQGRQGGESDEAVLDEAGAVSQEPAVEDIAVVQAYCSHCHSLVSISADLLVPGTLCPNCGRSLVPGDEDVAREGGGRSRSMVMIGVGLALAIPLTVMLFWLLSSPSGPRTSARGVPGSLSSVTGRLTMSGSLGDQVIVPTTCRSGQEQGYNGVELRVGRMGTVVQLVESAEGKYVLVTKSRSEAPVKLRDCHPFRLEMRRTVGGNGAPSLLDGQANLQCRDKSGTVVLQGQVWFHHCP